MQQSAIFPFTFPRKDRKFVWMDNACIIALGLIRPELINVNIAPKQSIIGTSGNDYFVVQYLSYLIVPTINPAQPQLCLSISILFHQLCVHFWQKEMQDSKFSDHNSVFWNTNINHPIFLKVQNYWHDNRAYLSSVNDGFKSLVLFLVCKKYLLKTNRTA